MVDPRRPFWPSLYSRLVPHVYLDAGTANQMGRNREDDAFLTDLETLAHHVRSDLVMLLNATSLESRLLGGRSVLKQVNPARSDEDKWQIDKDAMPLKDFPRVQKSVVNYGLPSMIGAVASRLDTKELERAVKEAIVAFEPRIDPASLDVVVKPQTTQGGASLGADTGKDVDMALGWGPLQFDVSAKIGARPAPIELQIRTVWDLEKHRSDALVSY